MSNEKTAVKPLSIRISERLREMRAEREAEKAQPMKKFEVTPFVVISYIVMFAFAIVTLVPFIWLVKTALVPQSDALKLFHISALTLDNVKAILDSAPFGQYYVNTVVMVVSLLFDVVSAEAASAVVFSCAEVEAAESPFELEQPAITERLIMPARTEVSIFFLFIFGLRSLF